MRAPGKQLHRTNVVAVLALYPVSPFKGVCLRPGGGQSICAAPGDLAFFRQRKHNNGASHPSPLFIQRRGAGCDG
jgi:hypothetical protein